MASDWTAHTPAALQTHPHAPSRTCEHPVRGPNGLAGLPVDRARSQIPAPGAAGPDAVAAGPDERRRPSAVASAPWRTGGSERPRRTTSSPLRRCGRWRCGPIWSGSGATTSTVCGSGCVTRSCPRTPGSSSSTASSSGVWPCVRETTRTGWSTFIWPRAPRGAASAPPCCGRWWRAPTARVGVCVSTSCAAARPADCTNGTTSRSITRTPWTSSWSASPVTAAPLPMPVPVPGPVVRRRFRDGRGSDGHIMSRCSASFAPDGPR